MVSEAFSTVSYSSASTVRSVSTLSTTTTSNDNGSSSAPKPMPMAVMKNGHEVIRGAMLDIQNMLDKDDFESARTLWHQFHRFSDLHMRMEEGYKPANAKGLFRLVDDHSDGAAKKGGLRHAHSTLYELEDDVVDIFEKAPDIQRAKEIYPIFRQENEEHLKEEEDILMPAIQRMMKKGVNIKKYIKTDILPVLLTKEEDIKFFLMFGNEVLERHDNVEGKPRVRVFSHAFWAVASEEQWVQWSAWIQESLSPEKYEEVDTAINAWKDQQAAKKKAKDEQKAADKLAHATPPNSQYQREAKIHSVLQDFRQGCCIKLQGAC